MKNYNLILFRKERNLSASDMAEKVGISESYYEKNEYGDRSQSYNVLIKIKRAFRESDIEKIFLSQNHTLCVGK